MYNLNGTDLTPKVLSYLNKKGWVSLIIYSLYDPNINKWKEWLEKAVATLEEQYVSIDIIFTYQSQYRERWHDFPWRKLADQLAEDTNETKVFLNCTWTPFQEVRVEENREFFEKNKILVMNVWGFIDFVAGFEKRAPKWVVKARVLETFRRIATNPAKNMKKFLAMFGIFRIISQKLRLKK